MLFPFRTSSIFRSRWMALLWSAGIIWTAVSVAGSSHGGGNNAGDNQVTTDITGAPIDAAQMEQAKKLLDQLGR